MNQVEVKRRQLQVYSEMIGIITLFVLGRLIGDNGIAYFAVAVECYSFFLLVLTGSTADTLGRILRGRIAKGQYKNVFRMRRNVMILQGILGALGAVLLFVCARPLAVHVFRLKYSAFLMMLFAPAVFLRTVSSVFLGYFLGDGSELPSAMTGIIRQVFFLGFSVLFCNIFKDYGQKVTGLLGKQEFTAMYGGAGAAVAAALTELLVILFLFLIYKGSSRPGRKQTEEGLKVTESFFDLARILYGNRSFSMLAQLFERLPVWLGIIFFQKSAEETGLAVESYGIFYGKYLAFCGFFVLLVCASLVSVHGKTVYCMKREEQRYAKSCFQSGFHIAWVRTVFFAFFFAVMAKQIAEIFCGSQAQLLTQMLSSGSGLIILVTVSYYFERILMYFDKKYLVLGSLGAMNVVFVVAVTVFLNAGKAGILALVYAGMISFLVLALLLGFFAFRQLRSGLDLLRAVVIPTGAAGAAGLLGMLLGKVFTPHLGSLVTVLICFLLSFAVYWCILLLLRNFRDQELSVIPGGKLIRFFGRFLKG